MMAIVKDMAPEANFAHGDYNQSDLNETIGLALLQEAPALSNDQINELQSMLRGFR